MKVIVANNSGFCFGVEKAIDTAFKEVRTVNVSKSIYSLGPLIHNQQVVDKLEIEGVKVIENLDLIDEGTVIIRSHGVSKEVYDQLTEKGLQLVDATCPFVKKIQKIVKEHRDNGYSIVIIGNADHPEVIGINGWCNNEGFVVQSKDDLEKIPFLNKLCIVVQTTMPTSLFDELSELLQSKSAEIIKFNTVCSATRDRQDATKQLAKEVDAMIVIGGYHSSNTQKLVEISKCEKTNSTFHIETISDLPLDEIKNYNVIGVTAGASTPKWIIDEIIEKITSL